MSDFRDDFPVTVMARPSTGGYQEFSVGSQSELWIEAGSGDVTVLAADSTAVAVRAVGDSSRTSKAITIRHEGSRVRIRVRGSHDCEVTVPRDCRVRVHNSSGDVHVVGTAAVTVQSSSGDITVQNIAEHTSLETSSGEISGLRLAGILRAHSSSGDLKIQESRLRGFELRTSSGDMTVETPLLPEGHYVVNTSSGDLRLFLPPATAATLHLHSGSGSLECALPAEIIQPSRRQWEACLNNGGVHLEMHASSGSLHVLEGWSPALDDVPAGGLLAADPAREIGPDAGDRPAADPSRSTGTETTVILGMLERGEIDVEEAMSRLDALE